MDQLVKSIAMEKISFEWHPRSVLNIDSSDSLYACAISNRPILFDSITFQKLWNNGSYYFILNCYLPSLLGRITSKSSLNFIQSNLFHQFGNHFLSAAKLRVLIDGGANRWLEFIEKNDLLGVIEKPSFVSGDMDSITEESTKRLNEMNVQFINTPDQDYTDLEKALQIIHQQNVFCEILAIYFLYPICYFNFFALAILQIRKVLIISEHSGRIDQILSQINMLHKNQLGELYLLSHDSLAWILRPGIHHLQVPEQFVKEEIWCSYMPFGSVCRVTTRGLKYDLSTFSWHFSQCWMYTAHRGGRGL